MLEEPLNPDHRLRQSRLRLENWRTWIDIIDGDIVLADAVAILLEDGNDVDRTRCQAFAQRVMGRSETPAIRNAKSGDGTIALAGKLAQRFG